MSNFWLKQPSSRQATNNSILYTGNTTSTPGNILQLGTQQIRVCHNITGGIYLRIDSGNGGTTTATVADMFIPANVASEYFTATGGQSVAIISTSTSSGVASITEMA